MPLTRRQKEILDFVSHFLSEKGYAPSLVEIGTAFGLSSPATVHKHLAILEAKGKIKRARNRRRWLEVVPEASSAGPVTLPLLGRVAAGKPIEAVTTPESLEVPPDLVPAAGGYVLQVVGESMIEEQIQDGDFVIVENRQEAHNGEMVVALLGESEVTLKKFYREKDRVRLQPANSTLSPLFVSKGEVRIQGVVKGVLRIFT